MNRAEAVAAIMGIMERAEIPGEERLGFLAGIVIGLLRCQGFTIAGIHTEMKKAIDLCAVTCGWTDPADKPCRELKRN